MNIYHREHRELHRGRKVFSVPSSVLNSVIAVVKN
jgi:hypothetical protein